MSPARYSPEQRIAACACGAAAEGGWEAETPGAHHSQPCPMYRMDAGQPAQERPRRRCPEAYTSNSPAACRCLRHVGHKPPHRCRHGVTWGEPPYCEDPEHAALEARAEADRQAREDAIAAERATYDLMLSRAIEANVQRDRAETAEARLVRCGGENCMGFDASKPDWPVARWVREERLQAAEAERDALRAEIETLTPGGSEFVMPDGWGNAVRFIRVRLENIGKVAAERNALRAFVQKVATEASPHPGVGGYYWGKLARETLDALTTPAASQEEGV